MSWAKRYEKGWRVATLVVMLVTMLGPWTFDRVFVPAEYVCTAPFVRLDDRFCGLPLPGIRLLGWMVEAFAYGSTELVKGTMNFAGWLREFLFSLLVFLLVLPCFSTLLLILRGNRVRRQVFNLAAWSLAGGVGLFIALSNHPELFWVLWGVWLYIVLAATALALEMLTLAAGRRSSQVGRCGDIAGTRTCHGSARPAGADADRAMSAVPPGQG